MTLEEALTKLRDEGTVMQKLYDRYPRLCDTLYRLWWGGVALAILAAILVPGL